jgi:ribokinase
LHNVGVGRVAVLGSLNTDLVIRVAALPGRGETVLGDRLQTFGGGKGANQAAAAARLGASVRMIGRVGTDALGDELLRGLAEDGVYVSGVDRDDGQPSGVAAILVEAGGENLMAVAPGANGQVGDAEVERLLDGLSPGDVVVLQLEIPVAAVRAAAARAREVGALVILNAAPAQPLAGQPMPEVDLLVVNEAEAGLLAGSPVTDRLSAAAAAAALGSSAAAVVVTLGAAGSVLWTGGALTQIEPIPVVAVDATAAGDAFVGAAAYALADGWELARAIELANAAGAVTVTRQGARRSLPALSEVRSLLASSRAGR